MASACGSTFRLVDPLVLVILWGWGLLLGSVINLLIFYFVEVSERFFGLEYPLEVVLKVFQQLLIHVRNPKGLFF